MNSATENKAYLIALAGIIIASSLITKVGILICGVTI
jgi:hypothetical protein